MLLEDIDCFHCVLLWLQYPHDIEVDEHVGRTSVDDEGEGAGEPSECDDHSQDGPNYLLEDE